MTGANVDPAESLRIIQDTLRKVRRHLSFGSGPVYKAWGLAWLVGFTYTDMVVRGWLDGVVGEWTISVAWILITAAAGAYTYRFFRQRPVETTARTRFLVVWLLSFALMSFTVAGMGAVGVPLHGIQFAVFAIFTAAVIYLVTGAVLADNVQMVVGVWLGVANVVCLRFGLEAYPLAIAWMGGGGLVVAGFIDDYVNRPGGERR